MNKVITMNKTSKHKEARKGIIHSIDGPLADGMLRIMKAQTHGNTKAELEEYIAVRTIAFNTRIPELQFVALQSNDRGIKTQAWLNIYLSPNVAAMMRGKVSRTDKELRKIAARAQRFMLYIRREEKARHAAGAHARLAATQKLIRKDILSPSAVPTTILAAGTAASALKLTLHPPT